MALVLDLTRLLPGPLAARLLAEMGHEVLRIEGPQGDHLQTLAPEAYRWLNQGKTWRTLDLKSPQGAETLKELVAGAEVLLETNRPGVMERLGLGPEVLRSLNPKLTYVRLAGYRDPQFREAPGHDLSYLAADGLLPRFEGVWQGVQLADSTSAFWGALACLQGMLQGGGFFEVYLAETARAVAYPHIPHLGGSVLCYTVYAAADQAVALAALEPHFWQRLCQGLDQPHWLEQAFSPAHPSNPVYAEIAQTFGARTALEWETWGLSHGVPLRMVRPAQTPSTLLPWRSH